MTKEFYSRLRTEMVAAGSRDAEHLTDDEIATALVYYMRVTGRLSHRRRLILNRRRRTAARLTVP